MENKDLIQQKLKDAIVIRKSPYCNDTVEYYDKEKVDEIIASLQRELSSLKKELDDTKKENYRLKIDNSYGRSMILNSDY